MNANVFYMFLLSKISYIGNKSELFTKNYSEKKLTHITILVV